MLYSKISNAIPTRPFPKHSTVVLLSGVITSPTGAFISKLPNGNLKASFLHTGQKIVALNIFPIKSGTLLKVKKTQNSKFVKINPTKFKMIMNPEGSNFKLCTYSKSGLRKKLFFQQKMEI